MNKAAMKRNKEDSTNVSAEVLMQTRRISKAEYFLRLLFPARCICCDRILPFDIPLEICDECKKDIRFLRNFEHIFPAGSNIRKVYSAFEYEGNVREAIHRLKFGETPHNASVLVDLSFPFLESFLKNETFKSVMKYDIIIPTPLHPRRKRQRGYNQSELIASRLSYHMNVPALKGVLVKKINTPPQSRLGRGERLINLVGVFSVKKPGLVKGRRILLVDDIMTTGSTLEHCAKALKNAGAAYIDAYVVAIRHRS
ncbi:phosphoribosyltransferase [Thermoclostridium stercorarium subsp. stercorarium DSM 8532]|jgi:competence protein ComFC|uniref:Phosphoribosyltransferase n=2 Tax=Thermoclostridium stercorarium TaxID=1510 RepID=L7VSC5_THES1|nr:phosphoribosyltransferase [Thermoclostridium stercorarium subsp. stercorarium DSM 8532]AGI40492.1 amidophosphoribosyltransferase [Thermoclostridium stercorarium subsp. stercorarium DSM 8532]